MDSFDATRAVLSRLQSLDPENATRIMGFILIQGGGDKELIRLAFGTDNQILSVINRAKTELAHMSNNSSSSSSNSSSSLPSPIVVSSTNNTTNNGIGGPTNHHPSPFSSLTNRVPINRPTPLSLPLSSPRLHNNGVFNPSSPSSPSIWSMTPPGTGSNLHQLHHGLSHPPLSPNVSGSSSLSYAAVVNGNNGISPLGYAVGGGGSNRENFMDDYLFADQNFPFANDPAALQSKDTDYYDQTPLNFSAAAPAPSPSARSDSVLHPFWENENHGGGGHLSHRRSYSVNDACFGGADDSAGGFKSCMYYNRGFCKNGGNCKFAHGAGGFCDCDGSNSAIVGSPCGGGGKLDAFEAELIRSNIAQHQRLATAQLMAGMNFPYSSKLNFLQSEAQRSAAAAMLMGEELHKFNRCRSPRNEFFGDDTGAGSRQIYLTFPADSTFREEDVSNYFCLYGPVQDVRIPYQQKRMFGFVTFVYPETVRRILAKGNPHFVCDSRVLVKPYKEKGKLPEKYVKHHQHLERGEFSSCSSPSGLDCREPFELQIGPRMFYNNPELLYRKKLEEQADLQQDLEIQSRRMMNLQLMELKNQQQQGMSVGSPLSLRSLSRAASSHTMMPQSNGYMVDSNGFMQDTNGFMQGASEEGKGSPTSAVAQTEVNEEANIGFATTEGNGSDNGGVRRTEDSSNKQQCELPESLEHVLPDNLFASPSNSAGGGGENRSSAIASAALVEAVDVVASSAATSAAAAANANPLMTNSTSSAAGALSMNSCFMEMPRFSSSGQGAVGM